MTSSATSRLRLDIHHIKVDFKKSEVFQPLNTDQSAGSAHIEDNLFIQVMLTSSLSTSLHSLHSYFECDSMANKYLYLMYIYTFIYLYIANSVCSEFER